MERVGLPVSGLSLSRLVVSLTMLVLNPTLPVFGQGGEAAVQPSFERKFYHAADGHFYVPAGVPIKMSIGLAQSSGGASDDSSVVLKEGPNALQMGGVNVPVIADGTPPRTVLGLGDTPQIEIQGIHILGARPVFHLTASDALSGVAQTMISIDGAEFVPLSANGPQITAEGTHQLRFFSVDQVGNAEPVQAFDFRLDSTAPVTRRLLVGPHTETAVGAGVTLSLAAQDAVAGVRSIRYRLDDAPAQPYVKPLDLDTLPEGPHRIEYFADDAVANEETAQRYAFVVDREPPKIELAIHGPLRQTAGVRYISPDAEIELTSLDAVSGPAPIRYRVDGAEPARLYEGRFHLPARGGIHRLQIESDDSVANRAEMPVDDIFVDLTPPATEISYSRPYFVRSGVVVLNPTSLIALEPTDFESGVAQSFYSLDGGEERRYSAPFAIPAIGDHHLIVSAKDQVGNRESKKEVLLHIENSASGRTPPSVLDAKRWYLHPRLGLMGPEGLPFELRISESPDPGSPSYLVSAGPSPSPDPNSPPVFTTAGKNTLAVALSPKRNTFGIGIDAAAPKTTLEATGAHRFENAGSVYFGPGLTIGLHSEDDPAGLSSGLWKTLYSVEGSPFATYTGPLNLFTREGEFSLRYYALDNVGNAESAHRFSFIVDTTAPRTRLELRGAHRAETVAPTTRAVLTATDNLSGVARIVYRIDEKKESPYSQPFALGPLPDGSHTLRYYAVDTVGNREQEKVFTFTFDGTVSNPSFAIKGTFIERGGTIFTAPGASVLLKAAEGDSILYTLDGAAPKTYTTPIHVPESGDHRLAFHAVDDLENSSPNHILNLVADRSSPTSLMHFAGIQVPLNGMTVIGGSTEIVLSAEAGRMGASALEYSLDGRHWQPYTRPFTLRSSGLVDLSYRAHNPLGAAGPIERQRFVVDAAGPAISVTYSTPVETHPDSVSVSPKTLIFISAEDQPSGIDKITCQLDDEPARIYRAPLSGFTPGKMHTIVIVAEDRLGNRSVKTLHVKLNEAAK